MAQEYAVMFRGQDMFSPLRFPFLDASCGCCTRPSDTAPSPSHPHSEARSGNGPDTVMLELKSRLRCIEKPSPPDQPPISIVSWFGAVVTT